MKAPIREILAPLFFGLAASGSALAAEPECFDFEKHVSEIRSAVPAEARVDRVTSAILAFSDEPWVEAALLSAHVNGEVEYAGPLFWSATAPTAGEYFERLGFLQDGCSQLTVRRTDAGEARERVFDVPFSTAGSLFLGDLKHVVPFLTVDALRHAAGFSVSEYFQATVEKICTTGNGTTVETLAIEGSVDEEIVFGSPAPLDPFGPVVQWRLEETREVMSDLASSGCTVKVIKTGISE